MLGDEGLWKGAADVGFGISEYTLVLRASARAEHPDDQAEWTVVRPAHVAGCQRATSPDDNPIAQVLAVTLCSTLALDENAYERFLTQSGVLDGVLRIAANVRFLDPRSVETARRRIRSRIMAEEVRYIAECLSA